MSSPEVLKVLRELSVLHAPEGKPFILKSGKESMHYVDVRLSALNPRGLRVLSDHLFWSVMGTRGGSTHVAGVALGGCPLATGVSSRSLELSEMTEGGKPRYDNLPVFDALYVRPEAKDHGTGKLVEGKFKQGDWVVLVEDVVTSGGSTLKSIEALEAAGLKVVGVVAVLDRDEGGRAKIEEKVPFRTLCTLKELLAQ